jgi:hypothetical protein
MTKDELLEFKQTLEETLAGFITPVAYGVGVIHSDGPYATVFPYTNSVTMHGLPSVVLGSVLGYRSGTCTLHISQETLDEAIRILEPAGECPDYDHPNLWAWQKMRTDPANLQFVAVFIGDRSDRTSDAYQLAFRTQAGWAE